MGNSSGRKAAARAAAEVAPAAASRATGVPMAPPTVYRPPSMSDASSSTPASLHKKRVAHPAAAAEPFAVEPAVEPRAEGEEAVRSMIDVAHRTSPRTLTSQESDLKVAMSGLVRETSRQENSHTATPLRRDNPARPLPKKRTAEYAKQREASRTTPSTKLSPAQLHKFFTSGQEAKTAPEVLAKEFRMPVEQVNSLLKWSRWPTSDTPVEDPVKISDEVLSQWESAAQRRTR